MQLQLIKHISILIGLVVVSASWPIYSKKFCTPGYYSGTVIEKTVNVGRYSSTHLLYVDWGRELGKQTVLVGAMPYKLTQIGDTYSTRMSCQGPFGAAGLACVPKDPTYYGWWGILSTISMMGVVFYSMYLYVKYRKRDLKLYM